jgi:hypothetical protein
MVTLVPPKDGRPRLAPKIFHRFNAVHERRERMKRAG